MCSIGHVETRSSSLKRVVYLCIGVQAICQILDKETGGVACQTCIADSIKGTRTILLNVVPQSIMLTLDAYDIRMLVHQALFNE